jgi:DNA-binding MurR/RpiR family transcriptional regulator
MQAEQIKQIDRKEAINTKFIKEEKDAVDTIKKETDKTKVDEVVKMLFDVPITIPE